MFANWRNEVEQADDALRVSGQGSSSYAAIRGSITTHTPLTPSTFDYGAASTAYRLAQMQAFPGDATMERLGLGFSGLSLNQSTTNQSNFGSRLMEITPRSVTFVDDNDDGIEDDDGWEADTEMHSDVEDTHASDSERMTGIERPGNSQRRNRFKRSAYRNRPLTPYHAPNGENSWLSA